MGKNHKEVNYAFIDSQNLLKGVQNEGWRIDLEKFGVFLKDKYKKLTLSLVC